MKAFVITVIIGTLALLALQTHRLNVAYDSMPKLREPVVPHIPRISKVGQPTKQVVTIRQLFDAIAKVESGGNNNAVGDSGRSHGRYQIQKGYWADAVSVDPGLRSISYEQGVRTPDIAERAMIAYWKRYCPEALANNQFDVLARIHNGGPLGYKKQATKTYWNNVKRYLCES